MYTRPKWSCMAPRPLIPDQITLVYGTNKTNQGANQPGTNKTNQGANQPGTRSPPQRPLAPGPRGRSQALRRPLARERAVGIMPCVFIQATCHPSPLSPFPAPLRGLLTSTKSTPPPPLAPPSNHEGRRHKAHISHTLYRSVSPYLSYYII